MKLDFDLENVTVVEFGVGRDAAAGRSFVAVPVDEDVQDALHEMVEATQVSIEVLEMEMDGPARYEPSEKHGNTEYLRLPLRDTLATTVRALHEASNLDLAASALNEPSEVFCYFARLTDSKHRRLTALRRATQFKGVLKKRLIRLVSDSLKLIDDDVFKLDTDFDLLVDAAAVHILRPSGFEFTSKLQDAILDAVPENVKTLAGDLKFVVFDGLEAYARKHPRAARYLASILAQEDVRQIDKALLKRACRLTGVEVQESKGKITIAPGHEMGFLEVLDRRRYELELIKGTPERFRAASRRRLSRA